MQRSWSPRSIPTLNRAQGSNRREITAPDGRSRRLSEGRQTTSAQSLGRNQIGELHAISWMSCETEPSVHTAGRSSAGRRSQS